MTVPRKYLSDRWAGGPYEIVPTEEQLQHFLELVARGGSMHTAASMVGPPFMAFARIARREPEGQFAQDLQVARQIRNLALEEVAVEQCTVGVDKVLTHQGQVSLGVDRQPVTVKELITSNPMLLALLKASYPEKYRERSEVNVNAPTRDAHTVPDRITNEADRAKLLALLERRRAQSTNVEDLL